MEPRSFDISIDGLTVSVTNDPKKREVKEYLDKGFYACRTVVGKHWAEIKVPVESFNEDNFKTFIAKRLREIIAIQENKGNA